MLNEQRGIKPLHPECQAALRALIEVKDRWRKDEFTPGKRPASPLNFKFEVGQQSVSDLALGYGDAGVDATNRNALPRWRGEAKQIGQRDFALKTSDWAKCGGKIKIVSAECAAALYPVIRPANRAASSDRALNIGDNAKRD